MICKIVELTNNFNWGKFMVARFDRDEWMLRSSIEQGGRLIAGRGWTANHLWVLDLQTGEGALFKPGGHAAVDLDKHAIWVCPMFQVFLGWLYAHPEHWDDITTLPALLELTDEETNKHSAMYGYRRPGPSEEERKAKAAETKITKGDEDENVSRTKGRRRGDRHGR